MPSINDMFPSLDFDTLNRGLNFINFSLPNSGVAMTPGLALDPNLSSGTDRFKDGVENQSIVTIEVNDQQLPNKTEKDWDKMSLSERINQIKSESSGMPIVSQIDLSSLRKVAASMNKLGMHKECAKVFQIAENFTKSITMNESETDGKHDETATVNLTVDKDGQPITINKSFQSIEEALEFYNQFVLPGVQEVMALESSMSHFGFDKEAIALRRFVRAVKMQIPEKKAQKVQTKPRCKVCKEELKDTNYVICKNCEEIDPVMKQLREMKDAADLKIGEAYRKGDWKEEDRWRAYKQGLVDQMGERLRELNNEF